MEAYISKHLVSSIVWSFTGDGKYKIRDEMGEFIRGNTTIQLPAPGHSIIDFEVSYSRHCIESTLLYGL